MSLDSFSGRRRGGYLTVPSLGGPHAGEKIKKHPLGGSQGGGSWNKKTTVMYVNYLAPVTDQKNMRCGRPPHAKRSELCYLGLAVRKLWAWYGSTRGGSQPMPIDGIWPVDLCGKRGKPDDQASPLVRRLQENNYSLALSLIYLDCGDQDWQLVSGFIQVVLGVSNCSDLFDVFLGIYFGGC